SSYARPPRGNGRLRPQITDQSFSFSDVTSQDDVPTHAALSDVFRAPAVLCPNRKTLPARAERSLPHGSNSQTKLLSSCQSRGKFRVTNGPPALPSSSCLPPSANPC